MAFDFDKIKKAVRLQYPPKHPFDAGPGVGSRMYEALPDSFPVVTYCTIFLSVVLFFLTNIQPNQEIITFKDQLDIRQNLGFRDHLNTILVSPWGIISSAFFHNDFMHIIFNCMLMFSFGSMLERGIGSLKTLLFFFIAAAISGGSQVLISNYELLKYDRYSEPALENLNFIFGSSLGLSGILYAIIGFMWGAWKRWTGFLAYFTSRNLTFFLGWLVLCYFLSYANVLPIANTAHLTGLIFGFLVGMWSCYTIKNAKIWFSLTILMMAGVTSGLVYYYIHFSQVLAPDLDFLKNNGNLMPW